ncbi:winged helix-turn-helix domain-containing protein [Enterococcus sp. LJL90]
MKQVLFLTKNIYMDREWQSRIQQLGYEVFCSNQLLERILCNRDTSMFRLFKTVVLSESIANDEAEKISELAKPNKVRLFRIDEQVDFETNHDEADQLDEIKLLHSSMTLTELRETLMDARAVKIFATVFPKGSEEANMAEIPIHLVASFMSTMSKKEKELFNILLENNGEFVSRVELSDAIWGQGVSNSSLAQLSQIIGRLKKKMVKAGLDENLIETHWNKGYALQEKMCASIPTYLAEKVT